jgi:CheY-like chemotaxis protein
MLEKAKILIVDNDPDELYFMEQGFESSGRFEIMGLFTGADELHFYLLNATELPDLVVTDLNMDGKDGMQIARELNANPDYATIKVIVLSIASGDNDSDFRPLHRGTSIFLSKPASLLDYKSFASDLYDRIHGNLSTR